LIDKQGFTPVYSKKVQRAQKAIKIIQQLSGLSKTNKNTMMVKQISEQIRYHGFRGNSEQNLSIY
jgi:hypothetical protein